MNDDNEESGSWLHGGLCWVLLLVVIVTRSMIAVGVLAAVFWIPVLIRAAWELWEDMRYKSLAPLPQGPPHAPPRIDECVPPVMPN